MCGCSATGHSLAWWPPTCLSVLGLSGLVFFLSQFFQLVQGYSPLKAGLAELPAAVAATVFGVLAGVAVRFWSKRAVLTGGLALVGIAMASLTLITPSTAYPWLGVALFVVGVGLGLAFTVASDVILASVPKERAGAAAAVSETAYELGMALGIATLGSIVIGVYRGFPVPPGVRRSSRSPRPERGRVSGLMHAMPMCGRSSAAARPSVAPMLWPTITRLSTRRCRWSIDASTSPDQSCQRVDNMSSTFVP